jgi:hypothetical protein
MKILATLGALAILTATANAQAGEWRRVQTIKPGATVIVETQADPYGWPTFDRCRLLSVDSATLTCIDLDVTGTRLTFPRKGIEAVYQVKRPRITAGDVFGLALAGLLIAGLASGDPGILVLGLIGLTIELAVIAPGPHPPSERRILVYTR